MQESLDCDLDQFADDFTLHDCLWRYRGQINSKPTKETTLEIENYSSRNSEPLNSEPRQICEDIIISKTTLYDLITKKKSTRETRNLLRIDPPKYRFVASITVVAHRDIKRNFYFFCFFYYYEVHISASH